MADPQVENGHIKIANEIIEALCKIKLRSSDRRVFDAIMRKTYGFNKKADRLSIGQIMSSTGLSRRAVIYSMKNLQAKNMIVVQRNKKMNAKMKVENEINMVGIQKDHDKWVVQRNDDGYDKLLERQRDNYENKGSAKNRGSAKNGKKVVQRMDGGSANCLHPQKTLQKTITKDTMRRDKKSDHSRFVEWYYNIYMEKFGVKYKFTGKDAKLIQGLLNDYPLEELKKIAGIYLNSKDDFVINSGYSIGVLNLRANAIAIKERGSDGGNQRRSWREKKALKEHRRSPRDI